MSRFPKLLALMACLFAEFHVTSAQPAAKKRPNIVFVFTDDQRWDALGCMGHPFFKSPNIDRIATEGAKFTNYFVTNPLCSPSRAAMLTGQYNHKNGVVDNTDQGGKNGHQLQTFPMLLQQAGYETAFIGKWHMGNDPSPRKGFDKWICMPGQGKYIDCPLNIDGKLTETKGYLTDILTDHAVAFVKKAHDKPFFLYVPEKACHGPFTAAERHKDLYKDEKVTHPPSINDDLTGKPALKARENGPNIRKPDKPHNDNIVLNQLRTLAAVDDGVGKILDALKETGQLDNTIVIYSSDNGFFWGEHRLSDKRAAYDESIRDPLLIRYPKLIKPATVIDKLALNIDLAPTLLELAGAQIPKDYHGKSLVPLLKGDANNWRTEILTEYYLDPPYVHIPTWRCVRTDRWKLIHYPDEKDSDELYDLQNDKYEMKNLINDPSAKQTVEQLRVKMDELMKQTS